MSFFSTSDKSLEGKFWLQTGLKKKAEPTHRHVAWKGIDMPILKSSIAAKGISQSTKALPQPRSCPSASVGGQDAGVDNTMLVVATSTSFST